ncbi:MAG TPA: DEAD/DEAH box helicase [Longimicrobiales bacterium]|nr:DEAD/DEAH box helicase [Longimicrobiales bacterium]
MAETFAQLGLRSELVEAVRGRGYEEPTALQRAAIPIVRRGGNVVIHASAGSGVMGAYGLGVLDRLAGQGESAASESEAADRVRPRALVLVPTGPAASRVAESLAELGQPVGVRVTALAEGWPGVERGTDVVVATPAALDAVRASRLKLDGLETFVVDGASVILSLAGPDALEELAATIPREAQRIVVTSERTGAVDDFVERHVRRALSVPPRPVEEEESPGTAEEPTTKVGYHVASEAGKIDALAALLVRRAADAPAVVWCRTAARAESVRARLANRGILGEAGGVRVVSFGEEPAADGVAISYDVPFDAASLARRHESGGAVLVEPRELAHLRRIAEEAGIGLAPGASERPAALLADLEAYRDRLRAAARGEDLAAQLLVLEPLFDEFSPVEVAAAASALLRRRAPEPQARPVAAAPVPVAPRTWVRLFISIGQRDGVRPGDLVGAITGEAAISGDQVGRIEIRDTFSIVEVASDVGERVIQALNGTTVKGRSLRVDYDRKTPARRPRPTG